MLGSKGRMVADPSIGVGDLMEPLKALVKRTNDKDLLTYLKPPFGAGWKSAVPVDWLCSHSKLFADYLGLAKNSILSSKKHKNALEKIDEEEGIIKGKKLREDGIELIDDWLRMGLSHLRQCRQVEDVRARAQKRCSSKQWEILEGLIGSIDLGPQESSSTALVPYGEDKAEKKLDAPQDDSQHSEQSLPSSSNSQAKASGNVQVLPTYTESIFDKVLGKNMSDPYTPEMAKGPKGKPQPPTKEDTDQPFLCKLDIASGDEELLASAEDAEPLHNGKSQQQRWNAIRKAKTKGKGKGRSGKGRGGKGKGGKGKSGKGKGGKGQAGKKGSKGGKTDKSAKTEEKQETDSPSKAGPSEDLKRKNSFEKEAGQETSDPPPKAKAMKTAKAKADKTNTAPTPKPAAKPNTKATDDLDPKNRQERSLLRKRLVSRAWHQTYDSEIGKGTEHEKAKEEARSASRARGAKFDKEHPRLGPEDIDWELSSHSMKCLLHTASLLPILVALSPH